MYCRGSIARTQPDEGESENGSQRTNDLRSFP
jgi:hypothetical protein